MTMGENSNPTVPKPSAFADGEPPTGAGTCPMASRDRFQLALAHREPDRVPLDFWTVSEVAARLRRNWGCDDQDELLQGIGVDFRIVRGPSFVRLERATYPDGSSEDLWGVRRISVPFGQGEKKGVYKEVIHSPLAEARSVRDIENYKGWPCPDWWDYSELAAQCQAHADKCVVYAGDRLDRTAQLKTAMYLRGVEQILYDLAAAPAMVECLLEHIRAYYLEYNRRVFETAAPWIDLFMMGDDFGTQIGPLMSIPMWRRYIEPGFRAIIELAHAYGVPVMHHTCGGVRPLIPLLIDAGLDILQSIQPRAAGMDLAELKGEYGRDLCFHGGIDIQVVLPFGTAADVREHVRRQLEAGKVGGGYIACTAHEIQVDVPLENVEALIQAYRDFAAYR